jgi:hypothetical protein
MRRQPVTMADRQIPAAIRRSNRRIWPAVAGCVMLLAACARTPRSVPSAAPAPAPPPPAGDERATSVLSCRQIGEERAAIAAVLGPNAGTSGANAALARRDGFLAELETEKGCR